MKTLLSPLFFLCIAFSAHTQSFKLEDPADHYKALQKFSGSPEASRAWMDTLTFPAAEYGNSIVYLLLKSYYLDEREIKNISASVKFPANSSDQTKQELAHLVVLQHNRTQEQIRRVEFLGNIGYWPSVNLLPSHKNYNQNLADLFFEGRELMGDHLNANNFPRISKVLQGIMHDMRIMEFTIKYNQLRPRPYHLEPSIQPLAKMSSPAFVSGHTLWAYLQAFTWSEIIPEKRKQFIALAEEIRRSREIMGIHYPSDNEAARQVAFRMFQAYFAKETFQTDLSEAIAEWKANSQKYFK
jgi:acid phosphatase (class A)